MFKIDYKKLNNDTNKDIIIITINDSFINKTDYNYILNYIKSQFEYIDTIEYETFFDKLFDKIYITFTNNPSNVLDFINDVLKITKKVEFNGLNIYEKAYIDKYYNNNQNTILEKSVHIPLQRAEDDIKEYVEFCKEDDYITIDNNTHEEYTDKDETKCPECGNQLNFCEGCMTCPTCGWSKCSL